jgi:hypothetical protein
MVRFGRPGEEADRMGFTADVSPYGMFVASLKLEKAGQPLWFLVELPSGMVKLQGEVVWCRRVPRELRTVVKSGFGIRLTQAPEEWYRFFFERDAA